MGDHRMRCSLRDARLDMRSCRGCNSLRAGLPLSRTHSWQKAKQSGRKESGNKTPRKWACPDLCNFFISASSEGSEIPLVITRERRELLIYYVWWGAIKSLWILAVIYRTIKNKWSTFGVSGVESVECANYWFFNKFQSISSKVSNLSGSRK